MKGRLAAGLILLMVSAWVGERTYASKSLFFLVAALAGTASGYAVIREVFRLGRRRPGRAPDPPSTGALRVMGGFVGFWVKLILGFALWALLLQFFRRAY
ncbi:MAG TPA: hypothetical protein VF950_10420 [Planctomycetota bacterium]